MIELVLRREELHISMKCFGLGLTRPNFIVRVMVQVTFQNLAHFAWDGSTLMDVSLNDEEVHQRKNETPYFTMPSRKKVGLTQLLLSRLTIIFFENSPR